MHTSLIWQTTCGLPMRVAHPGLRRQTGVRLSRGLMPVETREQLDTAEWTISRFAGLYQMRYEGMVTNVVEARAAAERV